MFRDYLKDVDFERARSQIATPFAYYDLLLDVANVNTILNLSGDFLYIDPASTGTITLELNNQYSDPAAPFLAQPGFAIQAIFKQIKVNSQAQAGKFVRIMYSTGERLIPAFSATMSITGTVSIGNKPYTQEYFPLSTNYADQTAMTAATPRQVLDPLVNTGAGGCIVNSVFCHSVSGSSGALALIAGVAAPASIVDGKVIALSNTPDPTRAIIQVERSIQIPQNYGLWLYSTMNENGGVPNVHVVNYQLLP